MIFCATSSLLSCQDFPAPTTTLLGIGGDPDVDGRFLAYHCPQDLDNPSLAHGEAGICVYSLETDTVEMITVERPGEGHADPAISSNGRYVAFQLEPSSGPEQVYLYDALSDHLPTLITASPEGIPGDGDTDFFDLVSDISNPDEIAIIFYSRAENLVTGDTNGSADAFLWRAATGAIERISLAADGSQPESDVGNGIISGGYAPPGVTADRGTASIEEGNRFAVFDAGAYTENLVAGDEDLDADVFLRDRIAGTTVRLSENALGEGGDCNSHSPAISADRRFIAFVSCAQNLGLSIFDDEVVVIDRFTGKLGTATVGINNTEPDGDSGINEIPELSRDGRFVLFDSRAGNLVSNDQNGDVIDIFVRDRAAHETYLVSLDVDGTQIDYPFNQTMDETGRWIAWQKALQQLDGSFLPYIWLRDRGDVFGPEITDLQAPEEVPLDDIIELTAMADETNRGNLEIASASYQIDRGSWWPMEADDGAFDSPTESIVAIIETNRLGSGTHEICVQATDSAGNAEFPTCVEVQVALPLADLRVRCTHDPVWPNNGTVTVTAEALTASVTGGLTDNDISPVEADSIEIWLEGTNGKEVFASAENTQVLSEQVKLITGPGSLTYGCLVRAGGSQVFSGWRQLVFDGQIHPGPIPVIFNGDTNKKLDFVFIPDKDNYSGPEDPQFQNDVLNVIKDGYYNFPLFLVYQDKLNFWIASSTGDAERLSFPDTCVVRVPDNWVTYYSFTDAGVALHTDDFRDCAPGNRFSTEPDSLATVLHETGHTPFGLADEYCNQSFADGSSLTCDGGYFQTRKAPNVYRELRQCEEDAPDLGRDPSECRLWTADKFLGRDWATSEPDAATDGSDTFGTIDLMLDRGPPSAADIRRILWMFRRCAEGKC